MVGIVIVSHSKKLAEGVIDLVRMSAKKVNIEAAGGLENGEYGTSLNLISYCSHPIILHYILMI